MVAETLRKPRLPLPVFPAFRRLSPAAQIALGLLLVLVAMIAIGPSVSPYDAFNIAPAEALKGPSVAHWLGTDLFGRDILTRVLTGGRTTLTLTAICTLSAMTLGTLIGLVCGYCGGTVDLVLMRVMDVLLALPSLLIALLVLAVFGSGLDVLVLAITVMFVPPVSRVARTAAMQVAHLPFVDAARLRNERALGIMFYEMLPNMMPVLGVEAGIRVSYTLLNLAALGFLGLGVQPPTPDWGLMISEANGFLTTAPWLAIGPTAAIVLLVLCVNILIDELTT
ncbi:MULTISPECIES: ABC transporter permease [Roseobacteraceae]|uniref:ABC transporter permease n=1 Tax=Roseobacteraceae TaxID=2854170 RepID=UPI00080A9CB5|nr:MULTISPECIES: ABC transporter permease [Roseobacteraceae]ANT62245.1 hypothetical protein AYJ57_17640 [Salipiger sp. CCB-MM3]